MGRTSTVSNSRISKASGIAKLHEYGPSSRTAYRKVVEDSGWWASWQTRAYNVGLRLEKSLKPALTAAMRRCNILVELDAKSGVFLMLLSAPFAPTLNRGLIPESLLVSRGPNFPGWIWKHN